MCNDVGKPVITATQMLESMTQNPRPTRAEASDVANAIFDGTSAVMLSAETATGRHPTLVARTLARLIRITEAEIFAHYEYLRRRRGTARVIAVFTESGRTARMMAQERVPVRIVAFTPHETTYRQLALSWGVHPEMLGRVSRREDLLDIGEARLLEIGHALPGDRVVFIAGLTRVSGATNMMLIRTVSKA
jgi:pyruvate kinase